MEMPYFLYFWLVSHVHCILVWSTFSSTPTCRALLMFYIGSYFNIKSGAVEMKCIVKVAAKANCKVMTDSVFPQTSAAHSRNKRNSVIFFFAIVNMSG